MAGGVSLDDRDEHGSTALHVAVVCGAGAAVVRRLVAAGADIRAGDLRGDSAFDIALRRGDAVSLAALLAAATSDTTGIAAGLGLSLLHCAALRGSAADVRALLAAGADAGARDRRGMTALMLGACSGDGATLGALLESPGADVSATAKDGQTALQLAAASGQGSCVRVLLGAGADTTRGGGEMSTLLMQSALSKAADTADAVLSSGKAAHIEATDCSGRTALHLAAARGFGPAVRVLLAAGADVTKTDSRKKTALMLAAWSGDADTVDAVLSSGKAVDLDASATHGQTALHVAAAIGCGPTVRLLLAAGANPTRKHRQKMTLLMHAASSGDADTVDAVLSSGKGGDVDAMDIHGQTALHLAAVRGCGSAVRLLLAAGADATRKHRHTSTLLMSAVSSGDADTVDAVLSSGKTRSINVRDADGETALLLAAARGFGPGVRLLLAAGADPAVRSRRGTTALMHAAHCGCVDMMADLLSSGRCGDIDAMDVDGKTALAIAACRCHFGMTPAHQNYAVPRTASCLLDWGADPSSPFAFLASVPGRGYVIHSPAVDRLLRSRAVWRRRRRLALWRRSCLASW